MAKRHASTFSADADKHPLPDPPERGVSLTTQGNRPWRSPPTTRPDWPADVRVRDTGDVATSPSRARVRMTSAERREQLIAISRGLFASRGFEGTSVEEIAASAMVSKPVVYEHFGGKEGLYAVVVDREVRALHDSVRAALTQPASPRQLIELGALALLDYIDTQTDGFRILARDSPLGGSGGFASILNDITARVEDLLGNHFARRGYDPATAGIYAQALVGLVAQAGQQWVEVREPSKETVAAHVVNLAWNGMAHLVSEPVLLTRKDNQSLPIAQAGTTP